jgi:hypothetical protein
LLSALLLATFWSGVARAFLLDAPLILTGRQIDLRRAEHLASGISRAVSGTTGQTGTQHPYSGSIAHGSNSLLTILE